MSKIKCCLCGKEIDERDSHNAEPLEHGRCCYGCNFYRVVPYRMSLPKDSSWADGEKTDKNE